MKNNNPVWVLFNEVRNEWPHFEIACLVSIGTGKPETKPLGTGLQEVMESCVAITTETEDTARFFEQLMEIYRAATLGSTSSKVCRGLAWMNGSTSTGWMLPRKTT
jgi:hypothetical protein